MYSRHVVLYTHAHTQAVCAIADVQVVPVVFIYHVVNISYLINSIIMYMRTDWYLDSTNAHVARSILMTYIHSQIWSY